MIIADIDLPQYDGGPVAAFQSFFYEVFADRVIRVQLNDPMKKQEFQLKRPLQQPFQRPSFSQFTNQLIVQNLSHVYVFGLEELEFAEIGRQPIEPLQGAMVLLRDQHVLSFVADREVEFDTLSLEQRAVETRIVGTNATCQQLTNKMLIQARADRIVSYNRETLIEDELIFLPKIARCQFCITSQYLLITNQEGTVYILSGVILQ